MEDKKYAPATRRLCATLILALFATHPAHAGNVEYIPVEDANSGIVNDLSDTFVRYAESVDRWIKVESPEVPGLAEGSTFRPFQSGFRKATVARLEYTYEKNGEMETAIYHAMSGTEPDVALSNILEKKGVPGTPLSSAAEQFDETGGNIRSVWIEDSESNLRAIETADGLPHGADAELKGLRNLERDIVEGVVPSEGSLAVRVSQMPCQSCRTVFDEMTELYPGIEVEVAYPLAQSGAYTAFDASRRTALSMVRNNLSAARPLRPLKLIEEAMPMLPCY